MRNKDTSNSPVNISSAVILFYVMSVVKDEPVFLCGILQMYFIIVEERCQLLILLYEIPAFLRSPFHFSFFRALSSGFFIRIFEFLLKKVSLFRIIAKLSKYGHSTIKS
jgi:hypothetical protein